MSGYSNVDDSCNESEDFECNNDNLESLKIAKSRVSIYISMVYNNGLNEYDNYEYK